MNNSLPAAPINRVILDFGDWGDAGRIAILVQPLQWNEIIIPAGFMSDGATVPRFLWWFLPPWGDRATCAAILHDYLCSCLDENTPVSKYKTRAKCDSAYYHALIDCKVSKARATFAWLGVRVYSLTVAKYEQQKRHPV